MKNNIVNIENVGVSGDAWSCFLIFVFAIIMCMFIVGVAYLIITKHSNKNDIIADLKEELKTRKD